VARRSEAITRVSVDRRWIIGRQWSIMRRWLPAIVLAAAIVAIPVYAFLKAQAPVYQASATVRVGVSSTRLPDYNSILASAELGKFYAYLATTRPLLVRVIDQLGLTESVEELGRRVSASTAVDGSVMTVSVRDGNAERAAIIANGMAEAMAELSPGNGNASSPVAETLERDLAVIRAEIDDTEAEIDAIESQRQPNENRLTILRSRLLTLLATHANILELSMGTDPSSIEVLVPAIAPTEPIEPRPSFYTALAALVALFAATAVAFLAEYLKNDVKDIEDIEEVTGLSVVGKVRQPKGALRLRHPSAIVTLHRRDSREAESYRKLRVNIDLLAMHGEFRSLLVTGSRPVYGKSLTAANLAVAFAQSGRRVILVDADLREPQIHGLFDLPNERGLTHILEYGVQSINQLVQPTPEPNLRVVTAGSARVNPSDLLGSQRMREAVLHLLSLADLVVFDSPPVPDVSDAVLLSSIIQETVLVVSPRRTSRDAAFQARQALEIAHANVLGAVAFEVSRGMPRLFRPRTRTTAKRPQAQAVKASAPQSPDSR
jgi:capsular exopolysaccharide synthesis family protein